MTDDHEPVDYALTALPPQSATLTNHDGETIARFRCPRCQGRTAQLVTDVLPGKGVLPWTRAAAPAVPGPNLVECQCGQPHSGRPENATTWGCGGYWNELTADG
ncbi:hypothetical protein [Streptomyces sp. SD15]